jgi:hypothetical protein
MTSLIQFVSHVNVSCLFGARVVLSLMATLATYPTSAYAWDKAIWPFGTPWSVSRQICSNSVKYAENLGKYSRRGESFGEARRNLYELRDLDRASVSAIYEPWTRIYWREMEEVLQLAWDNPDASSRALGEIVEKRCAARRSSIQAELEKTNPK